VVSVAERVEQELGEVAAEQLLEAFARRHRVRTRLV